MFCSNKIEINICGVILKECIPDLSKDLTIVSLSSIHYLLICDKVGDLTIWNLTSKITISFTIFLHTVKSCFRFYFLACAK